MQRLINSAIKKVENQNTKLRQKRGREAKDNGTKEELKDDTKQHQVLGKQ